MSLARSLFALSCTVLFAPAAFAADPSPAEATYKDIEAAFGLVPGFLKAVPEPVIPGLWNEMKAVFLDPNGAIPGKNRHLIAIGVAAQIPCEPCVYFHTEAAKMQGATPDEIGFAIGEAALTRRWSTWFNGVRLDDAAFRADIDRILAHSGQPKPIAVTDVASARRDIEQTFGFVPTFLGEIPDDALPGAWLGMKGMEMNPASPVPGKYISLGSLAVASQVPCDYCTYADTAFAKAQGANAAEVKEAVLVAALVRQCATIFTGLQYEDAKYRRDVDQLIASMKKRSALGKR